MINNNDVMCVFYRELFGIGDDADCDKVKKEAQTVLSDMIEFINMSGTEEQKNVTANT